MPSKTPHFSLDYLSPYQSTNQDLNMDYRRMTTIDNNLYALFKIFGNGIIVLDSTQFPLYVEVLNGSEATTQINVSPGRAFVNYNSINYTSTTTLSLPVQSGTQGTQKYYLYLKANENTPSTERGDFIFSASLLAASSAYIGIGAILVDYVNGVSTFYDDSSNGRQLLNVNSLFLSFINNHHHTGGLGQPKKVDLGSETVGYITDDSVVSIDSSKVKGGQISKFVAPQTDHNSLLNSGNLTHAQIDSAIISFRDHLNLEIPSAVNTLKVTNKVIRSTTENYTGSAYPTGSLATVDKGCTNMFIYVPNVTPDWYVVGASGSTGSAFYSNFTKATGPTYVNTALANQAKCDRVNNLVVMDTVTLSTGSVQKVFTLQPFIPSLKMANKGIYGYFYGFVPGIDKTQSTGDSHLIHYIKNTTTGSVFEDFTQYKLTTPERFNSLGSLGDNGVQVGALMTNIVDYYPITGFNFGNLNHVMSFTGSTGPKIISMYQNGYLPTLNYQNVFINANIPLTGPTALYCESVTGSVASLFADKNVLVNLNGTTYSFTGSGAGRFINSNGKVALITNNATSVTIYEIGASAVVNTTTITTGLSITECCLSYYNTPTDYRAYYVDSSRLYLCTPSGVTQLGYFGSITDMQVAFGKIWILSNNGSNSILNYAFDTGSPFTFNQVTLPTYLPSSATLNMFQNTASDPIFVSTISGFRYQVFDLTGQEIFKYQPSSTGSQGPSVSSVYLQFDLGDATLDMKY